MGRANSLSARARAQQTARARALDECTRSKSAAALGRHHARRVTIYAQLCAHRRYISLFQRPWGLLRPESPRERLGETLPFGMGIGRSDTHRDLHRGRGWGAGDGLPASRMELPNSVRASEPGRDRRFFRAGPPRAQARGRFAALARRGIAAHHAGEVGKLIKGEPPRRSPSPADILEYYAGMPSRFPCPAEARDSFGRGDAREPAPRSASSERAMDFPYYQLAGVVRPQFWMRGTW